MTRIGIIGGTGHYNIIDLEIIDKIRLQTPFGDPSDEFTLGKLGENEVVFLPRHGQFHTLLPSEVNNKANIWGMKKLGVQWIVSISAVGSLKPELKPLDIVIIDQFYDRTKRQTNNTFFGGGIVAHIQFAKPLCPALRTLIYNTALEMKTLVKWGGTYVNMEGPAFSTLAESNAYRTLGMDVIGMTQLNEAKLAREAEICYATIAMVTDYDCWYEAETGETVSVEMIMANLEKNIETSRNLLHHIIRKLDRNKDCDCHHALAGAIVTRKNYWPKQTIEKLEPILQKYL
jgi:5'-methylthioadenosine phosphorylase